MEKELVIIPGAYPYFVKKHYKLKHLIDLVYKYFEIKPHSDKKFKQLQKQLSKYYRKTYFINYKRKVHELIDRNNFKKTLNSINKINYDYDVIAFSYGGFLLQTIYKELLIKPRTIIFVGSLNLNKNIRFSKYTRVVNIYSKDDILIKAIIDIIAKKNGSQKLVHVSKNIALEGLSHSSVELNIKTPKGKYKNKKPYKIIKENLILKKKKHI